MMKRTMRLSTGSARRIEEEMRRIIADILDIEEGAIHASSDFRDDLGADSLDIVRLIMVFSHTFEVEIRDKDVLHIRTVGEAVAYLERQLSAQVRPDAIRRFRR